MMRPSLYLPTLVLIPTILFVAAACGSGSSGANLGAGSPDSDQVAYSVKIEAEPNSLSQAEANLVARINAGETVSFKNVTTLAQMRQEREYAELRGYGGLNGEEAAERLRAEREAGRERLAAIVPQNLASLGPAAIKVALEDGLLDYFGKPLEYDLEKANLLDPLFENTLQCYSGTMLYQFVARNLPGSAYRSRNFVTIFTKGHVRPGYMKLEGANYRLYGIEMNQAGLSDVHFGLAKNLRSDIVVVDADHFQLTEMLKGRLKNRCAVQDAVVKLTAQKYGIKKPKGLCSDKLADKNPVVPAGAKSVAAKKGKLVGGTLFSFGTPEVAPGRRPRAEAAQGMLDLAHEFSSTEGEPLTAMAAERMPLFYVYLPKGKVVLLTGFEATRMEALARDLRGYMHATRKTVCDSGIAACEELNRIARDDNWDDSLSQGYRFDSLRCPEGFAGGMDQEHLAGTLTCRSSKLHLGFRLIRDMRAQSGPAAEALRFPTGDSTLSILLGFIDGEAHGLPRANAIFLDIATDAELREQEEARSKVNADRAWATPSQQAPAAAEPPAKKPRKADRPGAGEPRR